MAVTSISVCFHLLTVIILSNDFCYCQQPDIDFSVIEEAVDEVIGDISQSNFITSKFEPFEIAGLKYNLLEENNRGRDISLYEVAESTGILRTAKAIDREEQDDCYNNDDCYLLLTVKIEGVSSGVNVLEVPTIRIEILDINDSPPEFEPGSISFQITENSPSGTSRDLPEATDKDSPANNIDLDGYELQSDVQGLFELKRDDNGLKLILRQNIDRETEDSYNLKLVAYDKGGQQRLSGFLDIHIAVNDDNDENPEFTETEYQKEVREDLPVNSTIIQVEATDRDLGLNGEVEYTFEQLTGIRYGNQFGIHKNSGSIYLKKSLDYETTDTFELLVEATDKGTAPSATTATVLIKVTDVNDEIPRVQVDTLTKKRNAEVQENLSANALVALIIVTDEDAGDNGKVKCSLDHQSFQLNPLEDEKQFKIVTKTQLDREDQSSYSLQIICKDLGSPSLEGTGMVNVTVLDDNDNDPEFGQTDYQVTVPENSGIGAFIVQVSATDEDLGENGTVVYSISDPAAEQYVEIDRNLGILKTAKRLDYEEVQEFRVLVKASDNGKKPRSSVAAIEITVTDENDQPPKFEVEEYVFDIAENSGLKAYLGTVKAHDGDSAGNNAFVYSIGQTGDASSFKIDSITGRIETVQNLDREKKDKYVFLVYATDQKDGFLSTSVSVTANILDVNDHAPRIIYPVGNNLTIEISNKVPVGYRVMQVSAQDEDLGQNANLSYFLHEDSGAASRTPRFVIDIHSGEITTNKDLSADDYKIIAPRIVIKDGGISNQKSASTTVTIVIDSSIGFGTGSTEPATQVSKNGTNTIIIVVLTIVTIIIVVGLVTAIFCLKRRQKNKSAGDDTVKNNDIKAPNLPNGKGKAPHITATPINSDHMEKNESFSISNASGNIPIVSTKPNAESTQNIQIPANSPGGGTVHGLDTTGSDDTLPSNADSGKGPSEGEADIAVMRVDSDRQRPINRRVPPHLDLANLPPDVCHNHQYMDHHRQPQSAGPYPRHHQYNRHFEYPEPHHNLPQQAPDQEFMSRSYPNSPNIPESEYVAPYFRLSGTDFDQWNQQQHQHHEMANMQQTLHHQHSPGFFGSNSIPGGNGSGMDSGYHSQNGPFSQSAPTETVFQGQHAPFNNSMHADSGFISQNGGYNQHSPKAWEEPHHGFHHGALPRQYSEPANHHTYYRMDAVPVTNNSSSVDV